MYVITFTKICWNVECANNFSGATLLMRGHRYCSNFRNSGILIMLWCLQSLSLGMSWIILIMWISLRMKLCTCEIVPNNTIPLVESSQVTGAWLTGSRGWSAPTACATPRRCPGWTPATGAWRCTARTSASAATSTWRRRWRTWRTRRTRTRRCCGRRWSWRCAACRWPATWRASSSTPCPATAAKARPP